MWIFLLIYTISLIFVGIKYGKNNVDCTFWSLFFFIVPVVNTALAIYFIVKGFSFRKLKESLKNFFGISEFINDLKDIK